MMGGISLLLEKVHDGLVDLIGMLVVQQVTAVGELNVLVVLAELLS